MALKPWGYILNLGSLLGPEMSPDVSLHLLPRHSLEIRHRDDRNGRNGRRHRGDRLQAFRCSLSLPSGSAPTAKLGLVLNHERQNIRHLGCKLRPLSRIKRDPMRCPDAGYMDTAFLRDLQTKARVSCGLEGFILRPEQGKFFLYCHLSHGLVFPWFEECGGCSIHIRRVERCPYA